MSNREVIERSITNFPRDLTIRETEALLRHLARELPANIDYKVAYKIILEQDISKDLTVYEKPGTVFIEGAIRSLEDSMQFDYFHCIHSQEETHKLANLRFNNTPDWGIEEYKRVLPLWDKVKALTLEYLQE